MKKIGFFVLLALAIFVLIDCLFQSAYLPAPPPLVKKKQQLERLKFSFNPVQQVKAQAAIKKLEKEKEFLAQNKTWQEIKSRKMARVVLFELITAFIAAAVLFWLFKLF